MKQIINGIHARLVCLFCLCCFISLPAFAEFYQYTDKSGTLHFTDNIADVPVEQRSRLKHYRSLEPEVMPAQADVSVPETAGENESSAEIVKALAQEKIDLDKQYEQLQADKDALSKMPAKDAPPEETKAYKRRVDDLNKQIKAYEMRRKAFKDKVDALKAAKK